MVAKQAAIWISVIMLLILVYTVCFFMDMDADKNKDTLLYAKFLANVKDKWRRSSSENRMS